MTAGQASVDVRAIWWAARVPGARAPMDTAHLKVHYPAAPTGSTAEKLSGVLAADRTQAPWPVVVVLSGINVGQESYRWLAVELAAAGFAVVTYDWVGAIFADQYGLTPGVDLSVATPDTYGSAPTTDGLGPVLAALAEVNACEPLEGLLDLDRVALFGHSAGGTVALQSAREEFFPTVRGVLTYGAHTGVSTMLGWPEGTVADAPLACPVMLMAGTEDGVIAASAERYGEDQATRRDPVERTFAEALPGHGDVWLVRLDGANHFLAADPVDPTCARAFLEDDPTVDPAEMRPLLAAAATDFCRAYLRDDADASRRLTGLVDQPHVHSVQRR